MAWSLCKKEDVMSIHPVAESVIQDFWSDSVEAMIRQYMGAPNLGLQTTVTEYYDGPGTNILMVKSPPLISVTSLSVGGATISSADYILTDNSIQLLNQIFPVGQLNITLTYLSGSATLGPDNIDPIVRMTAAAMVVAVLQYRTRAGADSSIKWGKAEAQSGEPSPNMNIGLTSHLQTIMRRMLRKSKVRVH